MRHALGFIVSTALLVACRADVAAQGSGGAYGGYPPPQPYNAPGQGYGPPPGQPGYGPPPGPPAAPGEPATWGIPQAPGWTLREREQWAGLSDGIIGHQGADVTMGSQGSVLESANRHCNTQFAGGFVFDTFRGRFIATENFGVSELDRYVTAPLWALKELCEKGPMYSDTVRKKVQRVEVRWVDGGRSSWVFTRGVLIAYVSPIPDTMHRKEDAAQFYGAIVNGLPNYL